MAITTDITIVDQLLEDGPLTVKQLTQLLGKAETTVRNVLKGLVAAKVVAQVEDSKPAAYEVVVTETDEAPIEIVTEDVVEVEDDETPLDAEAEAQLDDLLSAITAITPAPAPKAKKSRKVCNTSVPDKYNFTVKVDGDSIFVTDAYPYLLAVPTFASLDELLEYAEIGESRVGSDHSMHEIAALYYRTVADYLEFLLDSGLITRPVWYGRTCRLRHQVLGHGRGTALAKPVGKTSDK